MRRAGFIIVLFAFCLSLTAQKKHTLSGYIRDEKGEALIGATIYTEKTRHGAVSNAYGFYSLTLPEGNYIIRYSFIGHETLADTLQLSGPVKRDIVLHSAEISLQPVEARSYSNRQHIERTGTGLISLSASSFDQIPQLLGETDLLKTLQLLPGIQSTGEGSAGIVVRGGKTDQNLILLDEATVYNPYHLMGFFSVFNRDAIQNITVYKGDIPAQYGGRISSLVDVRMKDGSTQNWGLSGGIGTVSSHLNLEIPLIKEESSFLLTGRRSYADIFLPLSNNPDIRNNRLYFYDLNAKLNFRINQNNRLFYSAYKGRDAFMLSRLVLVTWGNLTHSLRWNHLFSDKLFSNLTLIYNAYDYNLGKNSEITGIRWESELEDYGIKYDFTWYPGNGHTLRFGAISTMHRFDPGYVRGISPQSIYNTLQLPRSNALESAAYIGYQVDISKAFALEAGIRYSHFAAMGEATVYRFDDNYLPVDTGYYGNWEVYQTYSGPEPRLSARLTLGPLSSLKAAYTRSKQYLHQASNSGTDTPLDVWIPSSPTILPQQSDQFSLGYFRNIPGQNLEYSMEAWYKKMHHQIDFRDHARVFLNPLLEAEFRSGEGTAWGIEWLLRRTEGRLTGWIAYTLSRSVTTIEEVNEGNPYPSDFDRRHDFSIVLNYRIGQRLHTGLNWVYNTGLPVTYPIGRFDYWNAYVPVYGERNSRRMPDYHRLDLSLSLKNKTKPGKRFRSEWVFSVYNAYFRKNAWLIYFTRSETNPALTEARKLYMFPVIPSVGYQFSF